MSEIHALGGYIYGFQGSDGDAVQLALTEQLFDAALGEFAVVDRGQPSLIVGDFNVEPTKIPFLLKGISAGPCVDLEAAWRMLLQWLQPLLVLGMLLEVIDGVSWLGALLLQLQS